MLDILPAEFGGYREQNGEFVKTATGLHLVLASAGSRANFIARTKDLADGFICRSGSDPIGKVLSRRRRSEADARTPFIIAAELAGT